MFLNKKIIGLIPARSGSKGIKNKNMQKLGQHSLIAHSVSFLNSLNYLDYKIISTDSMQYIKEAKKGIRLNTERDKITFNRIRKNNLLNFIGKNYNG